MKLLKNNKAVNACAIAVFTVIRVVMFTYFPNTNDNTPKIVFGILLSAFAILTSALLLKVNERCENKASAILLLIYADFFVTLQNNSALLLTAVLWELCALLALAKKESLIKEAVLVVVSFASTALLPLSVFSYVLAAAFIYLVVNYAKAPKKAIAGSAAAVLSGAAGFLVHSLVLKDMAEFRSIADMYTFGRYDMEIPISVISVIPTAILGALFLKMFISFSKDENNSLSATKNIKSKKAAKAYAAGIIVLYVASAAGLVMKRFEMYLFINQIIPMSFVALVLTKNSAAEKILDKLNGFLEKHSFAALLIFILIFGIQVYCLDKMGLGGMTRSYLERLIY